MIEIDAARLTTREINREIRRRMAEGEREMTIRHPDARHNLGVGLLEPVKLVFDGSVGYYCAGLTDGPEVEIRGGAGWGVAENMMSGTVVVRRNAGTVRAMFDEPAVGAGVDLLADDLRAGVESGLLPEHDAWMMASAMVGATFELAVRMLEDDAPDVERAVDFCTRLFAGGLGHLGAPSD